MGGAAERFFERVLGSEQEVAAGFHAAAEDDGLADVLELFGEFWPSWAEASRGAFAVDEYFFGFAVDAVFFFFGNVVRDVVNEVHVHVFRAFVEDFAEAVSDSVEDDLPVGEGHVGGAGHGFEIALSFFALEGRAAQFRVLDGNAPPAEFVVEVLDVVRAYLVAESSAAAVDHDANLVF